MYNSLHYKQNTVYPATVNKFKLPRTFTVDSWCADLNANDKYNAKRVSYVESFENHNILNHFWFKTKDRAKRNTKWIILAFILLVISLIIALILVATRKEKSTICTNSECVQLSSEILKNLDESSDACVDFYNFACGNYLKDIVLSNDVLFYGKETSVTDTTSKELKLMLEQILSDNDPKPYRLVQNLYNICLNDTLNEEEQIRNVKQILIKLESWPMFMGNNWKESSWNLMLMTNKLRNQGIPHNYFFIIRVDIDLFNTTKYIIYIDPVSSLNQQEFRAQVMKYPTAQDLVNLVTIFGVDRITAEKDANQVFKFRENLLQILEKKANDGIYSTVGGLYKVIPEVEWLQYVSKSLDLLDQKVTNQQPVYVNSVAATLKLRDLLRQTPKRVQLNYIFIETISWMLQFLTRVGAKYPSNVPLWSRCISDICNSMGVAISSWYVNTYFNKEIKEQIENVLSTIREEFLSMLQNVEWLDETTRRNATEKYNSLKIIIGYVDDLLELRNINFYYYKANINFNNYLNAFMSVNVFENNQRLNRLFSTPKEMNWIENSLKTTSINAMFNPVLNSIQLSAAYLKNGVFKNEWPNYIKYALVGVILGHEITHGFDNYGQKYDKNGSFVNWWSDETSGSFHEKALCYTNQYQKYLEPTINTNVNGVLTQAENIADHGGLKQAYLAYSKWLKKNSEEQTLTGLNYTQTQLFWIAYANNLCAYYTPKYLKTFMTSDPHSPNRFRVNGPLSNMESFANDFNCPLGTPMNPKKKCSVW